jgi:MFS family permease
MKQETFFLHQRGNRIAWFCSLQTLGTALFIIASSYISNEIGWRWWYGIFAIITGFTFFVSILFVPETKYDRDLDSFCTIIQIFCSLSSTNHECFALL